MEFKIPSKFTVGSVDYTVRQTEKIDNDGTMGYFDNSGLIEIATKYPESVQKQSFWHEVTHAILDTMRHELNDSEAFVNTFSSFLSEVINTME